MVEFVSKCLPRGEGKILFNSNMSTCTSNVAKGVLVRSFPAHRSGSAADRTSVVREILHFCIKVLLINLYHVIQCSKLLHEGSGSKCVVLSVVVRAREGRYETG